MPYQVTLTREQREVLMRATAGQMDRAFESLTELRKLYNSSKVAGVVAVEIAKLNAVTNLIYDAKEV